MANKPNSLVVLPVKTANTYFGHKASVEEIVASMSLPSDWKEYVKFNYSHLYLTMEKGRYGGGGVFRKFKVDEYITYKYKVKTEVHEYIAFEKAKREATADITERANKVYDKFYAMFGENCRANGVDFQGVKFNLGVNTSGILHTEDGVKKYMSLNIYFRDIESYGVSISESGEISGEAVFFPKRMTAKELMAYAKKAMEDSAKLNEFAMLLKDWATIETPETN